MKHLGRSSLSHIIYFYDKEDRVLWATNMAEHEFGLIGTAATASLKVLYTFAGVFVTLGHKRSSS